MTKRRVKKTNKQEKKAAMLQYFDFIKLQIEEYETRMTTIGDEACFKIRKLFSDKLTSLPEHVRNLTLAEYLAEEEKQQKQEGKEDIKEEKVYRSEYERTKLLSEKKKTLKNKREERKRSMSVSTLNSTRTQPHPHAISRIMSESNLCTPLSKRSVAPAFTVTPKFNLRVPIIQRYLRKPKPGEVVMSVSGSPLQNVTDTEHAPEKPTLAVPIGNGKVIKITEDTDICQLESDIVMALNDETKKTLENLKAKLNQLV